MALHWKLLLVVALLLPVAEFGVHCDIRAVSQKGSVGATARAVKRFRDDCGRLPYSLDELTGPVVVPAACQGRRFIGQGGLRDADGNLHYWKSAGDAAFVVRSVGQDRVFGSVDDYASDQGEPGSWRWPWPDPRRGWLTWLDPYRPLLGLVLIPIVLASAAFSFTHVLISAVAERAGRIGRRS